MKVGIGIVVQRVGGADSFVTRPPGPRSRRYWPSVPNWGSPFHGRERVAVDGHIGAQKVSMRVGIEIGPTWTVLFN